MAGRIRIEDVNRPVVGQLYPLASLWDGEAAPFPSEGAARWFIRRNREALVRGKALAIDSGRWLVNRERFSQLREELAETRAEARLGASA
ncbi:MAG TPA: hypothetical protein PLD37_12030 [Usitatibacteraceae bacterium]|nr:hypothetical protein [Usitatibacteraceae bacterium]